MPNITESNKHTNSVDQAINPSIDGLYIHDIKNEKLFKNEQKVGMLLQKRTDTRGVGISSMR